MKPWILLCTLLLTLGTSTRSAADTDDFAVDTLATGLRVPWALLPLPENQLLITQREGAIWLLDLHTLERRAVEGAPTVLAQGQGGLLDVALSPESTPDETWLYFTYSKPVEGQGTTTLARAQLVDQRLVDWHDLFVSDARTSTGAHYGSRIAFDGAGHVFFSIGDRGERHEAQNPSNHIGSILRLHLDGSVPADNPFVADPAVRDEIWSYGHRNPQGLVYDPPTQTLWSVEHGPRGGDELNRIEAGQNYGWPEVSFGKEYFAPVAVGSGTEAPGFVSPIHQYTPSIAPSSLVRYRGAAFADWQGDFLMGALVLQHLNRLSLDDADQVLAQQRYFREQRQRIRSLAVSAEGYLLVGTDEGNVLRIRPADSQGR